MLFVIFLKKTNNKKNINYNQISKTKIIFLKMVIKMKLKQIYKLDSINFIDFFCFHFYTTTPKTLIKPFPFDLKHHFWKTQEGSLPTFCV